MSWIEAIRTFPSLEDLDLECWFHWLELWFHWLLFEFQELSLLLEFQEL